MRSSLASRFLGATISDVILAHVSSLLKRHRLHEKHGVLMLCVGVKIILVDVCTTLVVIEWLLANVNMFHWSGRRRVEHPSNLVVRAAADAAQRQRRVRGTSYDRLDVDLSATCSSSMSRMEACCASPEHALGFLHLALLCDLWCQTVFAVGFALFLAAYVWE